MRGSSLSREWRRACDARVLCEGVAFRWMREALETLKNLAESRNLAAGAALHAHLLHCGAATLPLSNALIHLYSQCGQSDHARKLFDEMPEKNIVSYSSLISCYLHSNLPVAGIGVLGELDCRPNEFLFSAVLSCCAAARSLVAGLQCHSLLLKLGFAAFPYVENSLLCMYLSCSGVMSASKVLSFSTTFNLFSYNSMISGFVERENFEEAVSLLSLILHEMGKWDEVTFLAAIGLCSGRKDIKLGDQIHGQVIKRGINGSIFVGNAIVDLRGKCGDVIGAWRAFSELFERNVVSWSSIMAAFAQNEHFEEALKLWMAMEEDGVRPNMFTYAISLSCCGGLSGLLQGEAFSAHAEKTGFKGNSLVKNALIGMYSRSGCIWDARKMFDEMRERDVVSWNSMISGLSNHGHGDEAIQIFDMMMEEECSPTAVTFVGVLTACARVGLVDKGFMYLDLMESRFRIMPSVEHYTCVLGAFLRSGRLEEAERFMMTTKIRWDAVAWRTLLSACIMHKKYDLGKRIGEIAVQRHIPNDVGAFVLLSNMHARSGLWRGVAEVRSEMRSRGIKKEPGTSWIQIKDLTHVFISGDRCHPAFDRIYAKLKELVAMIRLAGYVPDLTGVLHDVEDEQKEENLIFHSEKLAVAFGILMSPPSVPIRVMKNLRICGDCHNALALISLVESRTLIVRDPNRFHCFTLGHCSCGNFW